MDSEDKKWICRTLKKTEHKKKVHLITYGDDVFKKSKERLLVQAKRFGEFTTIKSYGPSDLDKDFRNKFKDILKMKRLGGYEIWKPYIIRQRLNEIEDGEFLFYLDAGCTINKYGKKRYYEYLQMIDESKYGFISFALRYLEKFWTVKEIFKHFNCENDLNIFNSSQLYCGILLMKKNNHVLRIIERFYNTIHENVLLFTDYYSDKNQISWFRANRHGQSILSIIRKLEGSLLLEDETCLPLPIYAKMFPNTFHSTEEVFKYPFWATRIRDHRIIIIFKKTFILHKGFFVMALLIKKRFYLINFLSNKIKKLWKH